jgi:outer membrane protein insertion porin family
MLGKIKCFYTYSWLIPLLLLASCYPTRTLKRGEEWMLKSNKVKIEGKSTVGRDDLLAIVKQRPNRMIGFGDIVLLRFNLRVYLLISDKSVTRSIEKKKARLARKNARRKEQKKALKAYRPTFREYLKAKVGEPPVIYDTSRTRVSMEQISLEMFKNGYFNNSVDTSLVYRKLKKMVLVTYKVKANQPYTINTVKHTIPDARLDTLFRGTLGKTLVKPGDNYNYYTLEQERQRVVLLYKNNGFYDFNKDFIRFDVDSSLGTHKVNLNMVIRDNVIETDSGQTVNTAHILYTMRYYYVYPDYNFLTKDDYTDTLYQGNIRVVYKKELDVNPKLLYNNLLFEKPYYKQDEGDETYRSLSSLNIYRNIRIEYKDVEDVPTNDKLDGYIYLAPGKKHSFTTEARLETRASNGNTKQNSGNLNLGMSGTISFVKRNAFRNGEILKLSLTGGLEPFFLTDSAASKSFFNTTEFGPSASITFPTLLLPSRFVKFSKSARAKTTISASFNTLKNNDIRRRASKFVLGYEWNETVKKKHQINPVEFSIVKALLSENLQKRIIAIGDPFLRNTYSDQFILATSYSFTYSDRFTPKSQNATYNRSKIELAGNIMRQIAGITKTWEQDSMGSYTVFGIPFAQYIKLENEYKQYKKTFFNNVLAFRLFTAAAKPLQNSRVLPFEESYYAGGTNGIRAWGARSLGPGGYLDTNSFRGYLNRIGEIHLETNLEYRIKLNKLFEWAFFTDIGNIWVFKENGKRTNTEFGRKFYEQLAVGGGVGLRLDFNFFLFRFDVAFPLRDPSLPERERWFYQPKTQYNEIVDRYNARNESNNTGGIGHYRIRPNFNIGIGYPF